MAENNLDVADVVANGFDAAKAYIDRGFAEIVADLDKISARLTALEQRPSMKYLGPWREGKEYSEGSFVSDDGSLFHSNKTTSARPGASADWTLAVKRGRDGDRRP